MSIAIQNQLQLCYLKEFANNFITDVTPGTIIKNIPDVEIKQMDPNIVGTFNAKKLQSIEILSKLYSEGTVFLMNIEGDKIKFGKIQFVCEIKNKIYIHASYLVADYFNEHCYLYKVTHRTNRLKLMHVDRLRRIHLFLLIEIDDSNSYVATKYDL